MSGSLTSGKVLPNVPEPFVYWADTDPRTKAGHKGILCQIILDFEPFAMVTRGGFLMDKRMSMPNYKVRSPSFYTDLFDDVSVIP